MMGRQRQIQFGYLPLADKLDNYSGYISDNQDLFLLGQDELSKKQGIYRLRPNGFPELEKNTYGAFTYQILSRSPSGKYENPEFDMAPLSMPARAISAEKYIIYRSSAESPPNIYITDNFSSLKPVTDYHPQKSVNWMTSKICHWQDNSRKEHTAMLFKPEDFDSSRQYPVIFYYYEKCSNGLNAFQLPKACGGSMNIPWFVSNGYVVFVPDIEYVIGHPGKSIVQEIVADVDYLKKIRWADIKHMGIQGHSYGGYETNFIITQTNKFAAACAASGPSDLTSLYGSTDWAKDIAENGQNRIGSTPWQRPDLYIENSPLYYADRVKTPLLLIQSKADWKIPFQSQGISFFSALRRLHKPVWMLQYDNEGHILSGEAAKDYTIRLTQFFDHYLRGKPTPVWMSRGVPAYLKGVENGLGY